jgi:hypothetical protein
MKYLGDDDPGTDAPFGERALALHAAWRDLDYNRAALRAVRKGLARRAKAR